MPELSQELLRRASVEAPLALLQEQMKVVFGNTVVLPHMPLRLVPVVLDAVDVVLLICKGVLVIDP